MSLVKKQLSNDKQITKLKSSLRLAVVKDKTNIKAVVLASAVYLSTIIGLVYCTS